MGRKMDRGLNCKTRRMKEAKIQQGYS